VRLLIIAVCAMLTVAGAVYAQGFGFGAGTSDFRHKSAAPGGGGGCSNSLNFSDACNSQYIEVVL